MDYEKVLFGKTTVRMARTPTGILPEVLDDSDTAAVYSINI